MNPPVWLAVLLVCGWGILAIRFVQTGNVPFIILSVLLLIAYGVRLWRLTRKGK